MILDRENAFSIAQALSGAGNVISTDVIDLSQLRQIGFGKTLYLVLNVDAAMTGTSGTLVVTVQTDDNVGFSSAASALISPTYAQANLGLSTQIVLPMPQQGWERFVRLQYTLGGTTPAVTLSAHLTENYQQDVKYPGGFTVA
jgi:hypothetical protein